MNDVKSLSHSKWRCKYHIVFAPKYRRQIIYGQIKEDIGKILRSLCNRKQVELIEGECCPDHIHILVAIPPHLSVSQFMGYLKSKSSLMVFDRHANLKYKYGNRHFGAEVILTPAEDGMTGSINKAEILAEKNPAVLLLRQFENEANPDAHKFGTSIEILEDTGGDVDCLVSAVGTAGTVSGIQKAADLDLYFEKKSETADSAAPSITPGGALAPEGSA